MEEEQRKIQKRREDMERAILRNREHAELHKQDRDRWWAENEAVKKTLPPPVPEPVKKLIMSHKIVQPRLTAEEEDQMLMEWMRASQEQAVEEEMRAAEEQRLAEEERKRLEEWLQSEAKREKKMRREEKKERERKEKEEEQEVKEVKKYEKDQAILSTMLAICTGWCAVGLAKWCLGAVF